MESREFYLLDRHFGRLERCLEPCKLLRYLSQVGVLDVDDVEDVKRPNGERTTREEQVNTLLDILKRREFGLKYFIKALLKSKTQDYLGRELLEDEHFTALEVAAFMSDMESELDETQTLKLKILEQLKKHENTKHGLVEVQSSRSSMVLSDSGFDPDERVDHDDSEVVDYLMRELERERKLRQEAEQRSEQRRPRLVKKQDSSLSKLRKDWPLFGSVDLLNTSCEGMNEGRSGPVNRSVSLNSLNNDKLFDQELESDADQEKWYSGGDETDDKSGDEVCSDESERTRMNEMAEKLANLEQELKKEKNLRKISEKEIEQLCLEKEELYEELDETRYQLHTSLQDLRFDEEDELHFDEGDELEYDIHLTDTEDNMHGSEKCLEQTTNDGQQASNNPWQLPNIQLRPTSDASSEASMDCRGFYASKEFYSLSDVRLSNRLKEQSSGMKGVTRSWVNLNVQHYELDDYDSEFEVEQEKTPLSFLETLRKLRMRTNSLYEDAVSEGKDLRLLKDRVNRGHSPPEKNAANRRRNTVCCF